MSKMICMRIGAVLALALAGRASWGATIVVPTQQPTIQAAINAASNGDTITVAPGTYKENLDFNGKAITLVSTNGAASTTIDGGSTNYVIYFHTSETPATVVSGFTLINGGGNFVRIFSADFAFAGTKNDTVVLRAPAKSAQPTRRSRRLPPRASTAHSGHRCIGSVGGHRVREKGLRLLEHPFGNRYPHRLCKSVR